mmetsp:Transcript_15772/g.34192  ORF Transcript_15772/g.34192 Transcript_15772/m.34192 type:complete len:448 (-) Transcript_15772:325-1668(-)
MGAADTGKQEPGVRHRAGLRQGGNRENDAALALPFKLHRHVRQVGESAKHRVIEKWTRVVRAKEEAQDRVTVQLSRVAQKREQMTRKYRDRVSQLRKNWQVFRPRPVRAVRYLVKKTVKPVHPTLRQKLTHTLGVIGVMLTCYMAGSAPQNLPMMYILFYAFTIPCRTYYFFQRNWQFFLIDYCYLVNTMVIAFLLFFPNDPRVQALVWSMAQGPVAGAIIVWRCSWVFGFADHMVSVLIHLLPGLAVLSHMHFRKPGCEGELIALPCKASPLEVQSQVEVSRWVWGVGAPLAVYIVWQAVYFLIVQVLFCKRIETDKQLDTSYRMLSRRAARSDSWANRLVRQGRPARRIFMYGLLQAVYTVITTLFAAALYDFVWASIAYQNLQAIVATWNGAEYVYDMQPRMMEKKWRAKLSEPPAASEGTLSDAVPAEGAEGNFPNAARKKDI